MVAPREIKRPEPQASLFGAPVADDAPVWRDAYVVRSRGGVLYIPAQPGQPTRQRARVECPSCGARYVVRAAMVAAGPRKGGAQ